VDSIQWMRRNSYSLNIIFSSQIIKDLTRTRPEDPFFQKQSTIQALKEIACFYCSSNNVAYQQGLLDVSICL
jgi:TBC domain.